MKVKPYKEGALVVHEEITEHKEREKEYENLYEEYKTILENTPGAIFLLDVKDEEKITFQHINKAKKELSVADENINLELPVKLFGRKLEKNPGNA